MAKHHNMYGTPTYKTWSEMKYSIKRKDSYRYGKKIAIEWLDFRNFLKDMGSRPIGKTLDRIDNSLGYCKENCRWASKKEQAINRRQTRFFTFNGESLTLSDWSIKLGVKRSTLAQRYYCYKWSIKRTLSKLS
jgi:hypothetical protein